MGSTYIPRKIIIGNTLSFTIKTTTYPSNEGYSVFFKLRGPCDINITTTASSNSEFEVDVPSSDQDLWRPGLYRYVIYAEKSTGSPSTTDSYTLETGLVELEQRADRLESGSDMVTYYKIVLDNIEAVIQNRATKDQESYSVAGRSLSRTPITDLLMLYDRFKAAYESELNKALPNRNKIKFRMS